MTNSPSSAHCGTVYLECREAMYAASTVADVEEYLGTVREVLQMDHFIYGSQIPVSFVRPITTVISGYPDRWRSLYEQNGYLGVDPTVRHCRSHSTPMCWSDSKLDTVEAGEFYEEARAYGLRDGVSMPAQARGREWGMLSVGTSSALSKAKRDSLFVWLSLLCPVIHEAIHRITLTESTLTIDEIGLTAREMQVLLWAAEGKTAADTAMILDIAERTVIFHTQNCMRKLDVCNRTQAVAKAISLGTLDMTL